MKELNHVTALRLITNDHLEGYTVISRDDYDDLHTLELLDEDGVKYLCSFDADNLPEAVELKVIPTHPPFQL